MCLPAIGCYLRRRQRSCDDHMAPEGGLECAELSAGDEIPPEPCWKLSDDSNREPRTFGFQLWLRSSLGAVPGCRVALIILGRRAEIHVHPRIHAYTPLTKLVTLTTVVFRGLPTMAWYEHAQRIKRLRAVGLALNLMGLSREMACVQS